MPCSSKYISYVADKTAGRGNVRFIAHGSQNRYSVARPEDLTSNNLSFSISSAEVWGGPSENTLFLFGGALGFPYIGDFHGDFLQIVNPTRNVDFKVEDLSGFGFNDITTSSLLVATRKSREERYSAATFLTAPWNGIFDLAIQDKPVWREGPPRFMWTMFPRNKPPLNDKWIYIAIQQDIHVSPPFNPFGWLTRFATLTFYLQLYVDNGRVRGQFPLTEVSVQDGYEHDKIKATLQSATEEIRNYMNLAITGLLFFIPSQVKDLYLLPGNQTGRPADEPMVFQGGSTLSDVTLVLEEPVTVSPFSKTLPAI